MSEQFNKIKSESINLRKEKSDLAPVSVHLISTIKSFAKDNNGDKVTDEIVTKVVRSQIKKTNDLIDILNKNSGDVSNATRELEYLEKYLPEETGEQAIVDELVIFFETNEKTIKSMGKAMGHLKQKFGNSLNPSVASGVVKNFINS